MKRIGVLTSGGDAPGMNACIRAAVRTAIASGVEMVGVRRGYAGLIRNDMRPLSRSDVSNIIHIGGSILESSRCPDFQKVDGRKQAIENLARNKIEWKYHRITEEHRPMAVGHESRELLDKQHHSGDRMVAI